MGKIVGDMPCPLCREKGGDSSGNHLILFDDGNGYCNRCEVTIPKDKLVAIKNNSEETVQPSKENKISIEDIENISSIESLANRGISKFTAEYFGVRVGYNTINREVDCHYYPYYKAGKLSAYKVRKLPKKFFCIGSMKDVDFFGKNKISSSRGKKLLLCAGEVDTMSGFEMLVKAYPDFIPAVLGLPNGETVSSVADDLKFVLGYDEVIIGMDMDDAGRRAAVDIATLIGPEKARIMELSEKDINDMLTKGKEKEFINAFYKAKLYKPSGLITVEDVWDEATKMPERGIEWPWPSLTKLTYGIRRGEGYYIGAGVKIGKSEFVNELAMHLIDLGFKPSLFKPEEKPGMTVRKLAGKLAHEQFHNPDGNFTQQQLIDAVDLLKGKVFFYDRYGFLSWEEVKISIRSAVAQGSQDIFIDPITCLTDGMDSSEVDRILKLIARELDNMSKDLNFTFYCFCHLNNPPSGKTWEEGRLPKSAYFANSRAMMRACQYMIGLGRDKYNENEMVRNTTTAVLLEDRIFGNYGQFEIFYNKETGEYRE